MARTIFVLQTELNNQECITNVDIEADSNMVNSKKSLGGLTFEQKSKDNNVDIKEGPLKCEHCDYKCKKVITMQRHIKTKHVEQMLRCNQFGGSSQVQVI